MAKGAASHTPDEFSNRLLELPLHIVKWLILIIGLAAIVLIATLVPRKPNTIGLAQTINDGASAPSPQLSISHATNDVLPGATPGSKPLSLLPPDELPRLTPQAQELMRESIRTFQRIELERRSFKPRSPGEVFLSGLQRKLFLDDYTYATIMSGGDCSQAGSVYTNLLREIANLDGEALKQGVSGP